MFSEILRRFAAPWIATGPLVPALLALLTIAAGPAPGQPAMKGQWGPRFEWPNVGIHLHVLPSGKVLFWSRREKGQGLDAQDCTPRFWDPDQGAFSDLPQPLSRGGKKYNLFCSGHTFLPDGKLLVAGGHIADGQGQPHATAYDPDQNTWTALDDMNRGRWYPTVVTLADGGVLVCSGGDEQGHVNDIQQVGKEGHWRSIVNFNGLPLYPRMHVGPDGRVFMAGPLVLTQFLDTQGGGQWTPVGDRLNGFRDYAPSVLYGEGKVLFVGGGDPPTRNAEVIDLRAKAPAWRATGHMAFARRQHNATLLPDGTVLVTGGTSGGAFNDLSKAVLQAELWDPGTGKWTMLAAESVARCYHSAAVLLPDGRVLSAGGGEYRPDPSKDVENPPQDTHRDAQLFSPPYLFCGPRPALTSAPAAVTYGATFSVKTPAPNQVGQVTLVRLSSVTHSFNQNQRIHFLPFTPAAGELRVTAPANANLCPPGHYLLFVLNQAKVPSVAKVVRVQ
jgi:hypothetical protein